MAEYLSLYYRSSAIIKIHIAFACALFWAMPYAYAQSATATLSGIVEDQQGSVIANAAVTVINPSTMQERKVITRNDGSFTFMFLQPASYTIKAQRDGFTAMEISDVVLNINDQRYIRVQLQVGKVGGVINVEGASLTQTDAAVSTVVDRKFVENLPLNGRSFQTLITLTPGTVLTATSNGSPGQFSVNGQRSNANYFTVDGVGANIGVSTDDTIGAQVSGSVPGLTAFGGTNNLVSLDALQEFRIQTSSYASEFGRSPGGQVSLVTRSGTNEFHGSLFEYLRNEAFDANDWFNNSLGIPKPPARQNQFGGTFGGPVVLPRFGEGTPPFYRSKRTFFFFSFEGLRLRLPATVTSATVPSLALRQDATTALQPILNVFPLPNGPEIIGSNGVPTGAARFSASYSNPQNLNATSIRIDHNTEKVTLFGRFNDSPSDSITRSLSQLSTSAINTRTLTLGSTLSFTANLVNELRVNYSRAEGKRFREFDNFSGAIPIDESLLLPDFASPENALVSFQLTNIGSLNFGQLNSNLQRQINIVDNLSYATSSHSLKFGFDYRRLSPIYGPRGYLQSLTFSSAASLRSGTASQLFVGSSQTTKPLFTNLSVYGQDAWMATPRLTITYGVRWELNPPPSEASGNSPVTIRGVENPATISLAPRGTPLYNTSYRNFAPRLGMSYQLLRRSGREMTLRGGIGIFYDIGNGQAGDAFAGFPYSTILLRGTNVPFPIPPDLAAPPPPSSTTPPFPSPGVTVFAADPDLKLPYTVHWNLAVEQSLGQNQTVSISYVATAGRRLLEQRSIQNPNPNFLAINFTTNEATSDYHSLQVQYQRRLSRGVQALANYTWSHAIDKVSSDVTSFDLLRGDADFDVRHNFSGVITYNLPTPSRRTIAGAIMRNWSVDSIIRAQTAMPYTVIASSFFNLDGTLTNIRPNLISDVLLYLDDPGAPGGRRLNRAAFDTSPATSNPVRQGNLGRNTLRGFPLSQVDFALRRQFNLTERLNIQLRAEAFNLFNHPNFANPNNDLQSSGQLFGLSNSMLAQSFGTAGLSPRYQAGGPRSLQFALKLQF